MTSTETIVQTTGIQTTGAVADAEPQARPVRNRRSTRLTRLGLVAGAGLTNTVIFLVAHAAGTNFTITDPGAAAKSHTFAAAEIGIFSVIFALAGWATFAALERWTRRPQVIWAVLATFVVLLSFVPIGIEHATTSTRIMLGVIHTMVALALLPMLRRPQSD
jgi:hypothetical protein